MQSTIVGFRNGSCQFSRRFRKAQLVQVISDSVVGLFRCLRNTLIVWMFGGLGGMFP
jgi:hypothetical protein